MKQSIALFVKELQARSVSLAATSFYGLLFALMYVALFPSIRQNSAQLSQVINAMGGTLKVMGIQNFGFTTLESFFSIEYLTIVWPLLVIILAALWSGGMIAGEIENGTMGQLLAMPFGRARIFLIKYFSGVVGLIVFTIVTVGASKPLALAFNLPFSTNHYFKTVGLCLLFGLTFFSFGMMVSAITSERSKALSAVGGLAIVMYVLMVISGLKDSLSWLKNLSFFSFLDAQNVLVKGEWSWMHAAVFAVTIVVTLLLGVVLFNRRDISV